ncbi:MAG: DUF1223 domain-containing protein [Ferruginibacter sp.]
MKFKIFSAIIFIAFIIVACSFKKKEAVHFNVPFEPIAVIELFTSQGCSSCPPADALLAETIADATKNNNKIFALSFHVDYWNRLGWADPFSNAAYSARQNDYVTAFGLDGAYTPQMIVNGNKEFIGSDKTALATSLTNALNTKAAINFSALNVAYSDAKSVKVQYAIDGNFSGATINFALVSLSETTVVKRGENGGHTLTNENVVHQFITKNAAVSGEIEFTNNNVVKENMAIIVFVQQEKDKKIVGAAMAKIN